MPPFNIHVYFKGQKSVIDRAMNRYLRPRGKRPSILYQAMRYGVFSGGKRFRPILTLASGGTFGGRQRVLLPFACALELVHEVSRAAGMEWMVGGQAIDLKAEGREVGLATVESIHKLKTGTLIFTAAWMGARIAGAKPDEVKKIGRYGKLLGLAFQITDDILDAETQENLLERGRSSDQERKKATYPSVVGLVMAKERVRELTGLCLKQVRDFGPAAEPLRGIAGFVL
ncbi:MAG TPA: polyprenyl synthetase family protein, partial [Candidatus Manganitrophaceae bacterium]